MNLWRNELKVEMRRILEQILKWKIIGKMSIIMLYEYKIIHIRRIMQYHPLTI